MEREPMIHVFLYSHYADWEIAYLLPEFVENGHKHITFSLTDEPVNSLGSMKVIPDQVFSKISKDDVSLLILPGGDFWEKFENQEFEDFVMNLREKRVPIAAICGATLYLAKIGVLNDSPHTSNSLQYLKNEPKYKGELLYQNDLAVSEDGLITSGGFASIEFSLEVLKTMEVYSPSDCKIWYQAFKHGENPPEENP